MPYFPTVIQDDAISEEILEELEVLTPLSTLDPDAIDLCTTRQRAFLLAFINTGTIANARKQSGVQITTWRNWQNDAHFMEMFKRVKSPVVLSSDLANSLVHRSMLELFRMLTDEKIAVRQWAIDRVAGLQAAKAKEKDRSDDRPQLSRSEVDRLANSILNQLPEADRERFDKPPFEFVDGSVRELEPEPSDSE